MQVHPLLMPVVFALLGLLLLRCRVLDPIASLVLPEVIAWKDQRSILVLEFVELVRFRKRDQGHPLFARLVQPDIIACQTHHLHRLASAPQDRMLRLVKVYQQNASLAQLVRLH